MLGSLEGLKSAGQIGLDREGRQGGPGRRYKMPRMGRGRGPITAQISLCELSIEQGHLGGGVAEQLHEGGKADARAKHLGGVGMAEHVGSDDSINAQEGPHLSEFATQFPQQ